MIPTKLPVILCCILSLSAAAQSVKPVLYLREHNTEHLSEYYTYWLQSFDEPERVELADSAYRRGAFAYGTWHKPLRFEDARKRLWVRMVVSNIDSGNNSFVWSIPGFLDTATLFRSTSNGFAKAYTATYWDVARSRGFPARPLCLPFSLSYGEMTTMYLAIDEHGDMRPFFLNIQPTDDLRREEQGFITDRHWFWLFGFYLFGGVFSLILFSLQRDRLYLWCFLYVLLNTVFLLMEDNLDGLVLPQWLYSFVRHMGQYNFLLLGTAAGMRMMQAYTRQPARSPRLYTIGTGLFWIACFYMLFTIVIENGFPHARLAASHLIEWGRIGLIFVNLLFIGSSLLTGVYRRSLSAFYYGLTYSAFFFSCLVFMSNHLGITGIDVVKPNILAWGFFFQVLTLSVLLTGRYRYRKTGRALEEVRAAA